MSVLRTFIVSAVLSSLLAAALVGLIVAGNEDTRWRETNQGVIALPEPGADVAAFAAIVTIAVLVWWRRRRARREPLGRW